MTSNNSNNVNNANGGESGNGADGAIEGVAIEVAANFTGSEQRQAAVNDAAVANGSAGGWGVEPGSAAGRADGGRAAADNGGTDEYAGNRAAGLGDAEWAAGPGLLDAEPPDTVRLGIGSRQLRAVPAMLRTVRCRGATARDRVRRGTRRMRRRRQ